MREQAIVNSHKFHKRNIRNRFVEGNQTFQQPARTPLLSPNQVQPSMSQNTEAGELKRSINFYQLQRLTLLYDYICQKTSYNNISQDDLENLKNSLDGDENVSSNVQIENQSKDGESKG